MDENQIPAVAPENMTVPTPETPAPENPPAPTAEATENTHVEPIAETPAGAEQIVLIPLDRIVRNENQPRQEFDQEALQGLASNIRQVGLLTPIIVTKPGADGKHVIIAGERRYRAMEMLRKKEIPAIVRDVKPENIYAMSASENLARKDMTPYEEAMVYKFYEGQGKNQGQISTMFGKPRSTIVNMLGLLDLPRNVVDELAKQDTPLTQGHAKALKGLKEHPEAIQVLFKRIMEERVGVRFTEEQVKEIKAKLEKGASVADATASAAVAPRQTNPRTQGDGTVPQNTPNGTPAGNTGTAGAASGGETDPGLGGAQAPPEPAASPVPPILLEMCKAMRTKLRADVSVVPQGTEFVLKIKVFSATDLARIAATCGVDDQGLLQAVRELA